MMNAIKSGDQFAFEQAYITFRAKVYGYFLKRTKSHEDALDLLQTTFLKLWKYRKSISDQFTPDQHIYHIARTVFIDHLRKQTRKKRVISAHDVTAIETSPAVHQVNDFDVKKRLHEALSTMPEVRQKVFKYSKLYGCSYEEIAEQLCISVKSVDNNLTKAIRQLRKVMLLLAFAILHSI